MDAVATAFGLVFQPYVLLVILLSALYGLFVGAIPGLTATMATALLVPVTFFMPPVPAVAAIVTATAMAIFSRRHPERAAAHAGHAGLGGLHRRGLPADQARARPRPRSAPGWCSRCWAASSACWC